MSEEAAFLAALKANPADDTTRLVYADWLDEHGEPAKAKYLRLVAALTRREENLAEASEAPRVLEIAKNLPEDWRSVAGARFALVLVAWTDKVLAIKWIREVTGVGLGQAKAASEALPQGLFTNSPVEYLATIDNRARSEGFVKLRISTDAPSALTRYDLVVSAGALDQQSGSETAEAARNALAAVLVAALGITVEVANRQAELNRVFVLATGLTLQEVRNRRLELNTVVPTYDHTRGWWVTAYWLHNPPLYT